MAKNKYTLTLPDKIDDTLTGLAEKEDVSKPEIMRRAINLYSHLYNEIEKSNGSICIVGESGNLIKEVVFQ